MTASDTGMFKYADGWGLSARILRLYNDHADYCRKCALHSGQDPEWLPNRVREIASDRELVWC